MLCFGKGDYKFNREIEPQNLSWQIPEIQMPDQIGILHMVFSFLFEAGISILGKCVICLSISFNEYCFEYNQIIFVRHHKL